MELKPLRQTIVKEKIKYHFYFATEFNIKSLNLLLYSAGGTHDTSLLKNVVFIRYSMFFIPSKLVKKSIIDIT